ncbi:hypothetical protein SAMN03159496_02203 [Rhizobium sp. NFR07]|jgi:hypothetical protein|uniref:DUF2188 domain-containing protein n=1 Tax=Rhizobium sp. NFR07 TaxID=1566262 RepID=UPI0008F009DD|nr:DUF2188 domain-containing protein [Rhizobium sp. NFR07]SFB18250.1 hypothetical protein SAMN03159496_02203 [Rhizobium sp. NFR07]
MQNYCDIMPHVTGWVYVIDGVQSASSYHTYELALEAARTQLRSHGGYETKIFRRQGLNGNMTLIQSVSAIQPNNSGVVAHR